MGKLGRIKFSICSWSVWSDEASYIIRFNIAEQQRKYTALCVFFCEGDSTTTKLLRFFYVNEWLKIKKKELITMRLQRDNSQQFNSRRIPLVFLVQSSYLLDNSNILFHSFTFLFNVFKVIINSNQLYLINIYPFLN